MCFVHNLTLFDKETQNLNVRSNTKRVSGKSKKEIKKKNFLEPDAFSGKQYFEIRACNFFAL